MTLSRFDKMTLAGLSVVVPEGRRAVEEDADLFGRDAVKLARLKKMLGLGTRHVAPEGCTASDLCLAAARRLMADMSLDPGRFDALIAVIQVPDHLQPASVYRIHQALDLPKSCVALELNSGCPGFVNGLWMAGGLLQSGACREVLLVVGEVYFEPGRGRDQVLFGAAGCAAWLRRDENAAASFFSLGADGQGYESIVRPSGGARLPVRDDTVNLEFVNAQGEPGCFREKYLNGLDVFNFAISQIPSGLVELLRYADIGAEAVDFAAIHQANKQIVDMIAAKSGFRARQYSTETFSRYGNQAGVSVAGNLAHLLAPRLREGSQKVLCSGFGIGLSWAHCLMELGPMYCSGVVEEQLPDPPRREAQISYWLDKMKG